METEFCSVSLDIIGKAVFNYEFGSVTKESPVIQAVYSALKEVRMPAMELCMYQCLLYLCEGGASIYYPTTILEYPFRRCGGAEVAQV